MATQLKLDPATEQAMDELIHSGDYASREDLVREAVRLVRVRGGFDADVDSGAVEEHTRQAVERGVADVKAGRARPVADVFRDLRQRYETN
jgi:antitoxin ParD1/3/4